MTRGPPADSPSTPAPERRAVAAIHAALEQLGRSAPLLLLVEDVHWADRSTRELLSFLFSRRFDSPVAVVASYRTDDLHRRHPLRTVAAEWARLPGVTRVELARLADDDVRALVHSLHPSAAARARVQGIVARAEGNAFFTEELLQAADARSRGRCPRRSPTCCWCGSTGSTTTPGWWCAPRPSPGRRVPHLLLERVLDGQAAALDAALRTAVERNVLCRWAATATPSGTRCSPRRSTTTCCPASGCGCTPPTSRRCSRAGSAARPPSWPGTPALANDLATAARASIAAGDEAMRRRRAGRGVPALRAGPGAGDRLPT